MNYVIQVRWGNDVQNVVRVHRTLWSIRGIASSHGTPVLVNRNELRAIIRFLLSISTPPQSIIVTDETGYVTRYEVKGN
jgi:hypothetical protein